jgi:hypothetical protein
MTTARSGRAVPAIHRLAVGSRTRRTPWREKLAVSNVVGGEHVDTVDVRRTNLMDPSSGAVSGSAPGVGA